MARTKASVGAKVSSGKSNKARCSAAPPPTSAGASGGAERGARSTGGGNSVCPRDTPAWQRAITSFFISKPTSQPSNNHDPDNAGSSRPKPKRNIIESDEEQLDQQEMPKNNELNESIHLEPLTGDHSHKLQEYYQTSGEKGKGVGKRTKGKEKLNHKERNNKREREGSLEESVSKKVKI